MPPESRQRIGDCEVFILGTVAGFVPDGERVRTAFESWRPDAVALGVPDEDLASLGFLAKHPMPASLIGAHEAPPPRRRLGDPGAGAAGFEFITRPAPPPPPQDPSSLPVAGLDAASARLLELLAPFGATRLPSPDLEVAWQAASAAGVRVVALDLSDDAHAAFYARSVSLFGLVGRQRAQGRALQRPIPAQDAYELAIKWDAIVNGPRSLARVEAERERHMAARLREEAATVKRLLAVVPVARLAGVLANLAKP